MKRLLMKNIYNELRIHEGKLTEFGHVLVEKNIYSGVKIAIENGGKVKASLKEISINITGITDKEE